MRIISGICKGRKLKSPKGMDTRPTLDRVRETIFNVLQHKGIAQRKVLDLFAGTGAMGLEAISRGALSLVAIDNKTSKLIEENAELCQVLDRVTIYNKPIEISCKILTGGFDLIFADPPYNKGYLSKTIQSIDRFLLANDGSIIVLEGDKKETFEVPDTWMMIKEQVFGYTKVYYYIHRNNEGD